MTPEDDAKASKRERFEADRRVRQELEAKAAKLPASWREGRWPQQARLELRRADGVALALLDDGNAADQVLRQLLRRDTFNATDYADPPIAKARPFALYGGRHLLGTFDTEKDATIAREAAIAKQHGHLKHVGKTLDDVAEGFRVEGPASKGGAS